MWATLPHDLILRVLDHVSLPTLAPTCASLRATSRAWEAATRPLLEQLALRMKPAADALASPRSPAASASASLRRSSRCSLAPPEAFAQAVRALRMRTEAMHHGLAVMGQDTKDVTAARVKKLWERWTPCLLDRASPVYDASMLMEVCRARVHEKQIAAAAAELLRLGADANAANSEGLSPLIMASARGLPKVVRLLLAHGAHHAPRGLGRFRLADTPRSIRGRMSAVRRSAPRILHQDQPR